MSMPAIPTSSYPEHRLEGADHLACMYRCELERREVLVSFLRPALEALTDAAMVSSPLLAQPVIDSLQRQKLPVAERLRWAQLGRTGLRLLGPNHGKTAAEAVLAMLAGQGRPRQYARVAIDVAFVLGLSPTLHDTRSFVRTTGGALERAGVIALFLYNTAGFEPADLLEMFAVHKRIAIGSLVHDNPYHCPEPAGADSRFRALLLDTCMQNLALDWTAPSLLDGVIEAQPKPSQPSSLSEAHCALIIDRIADGIVLIDLSGRVVLANRAAGQLLGRPAESIVGQWFGFPLVTEGTVEIDLVRPDGEPRTAEMRVAEIPWRGGRVLLASLRDTTERRIAEQALRRSEANFRALTEASPDAIVVHRNGMIAYVNPACLRLFGYETRTMLIGRPVSDLIHAEDRPRVQGLLEALRHDQGPYPPSEQRFQRKDGAEVMLEVVTVPVTYEDQSAFVAIARDLTERNRIASYLTHADKMASLGTLAAGVAHEINNPLTYVMWSLDSLGQALPSLSSFLSRAPGAATLTPTPPPGGLPVEWTPKEVDSLTTRVAEAADGARRIRSIVRGLSSFSRGDPNTKGLVDVHRAVESAVMLAANEIKHRARLLKQFHPVPMVEADEGRLSQVFLTLLVNAAHAIREGDAEHNTVTVRTMLDGTDVVVEVEDTGEGISREVLPRIFEPFFTTKAQGVGLGLGLFVCHNIVRGYSGRVEVWTHPGQGSRFRVLLPGLASVERASDEAVPAPAPSERAIANLRPRVLVVDDEPMVGLVAQRLLEKEYDVTVVHSGAEAQTLLRADAGFGLVVTDLMMPDVSGMDLFDWIGRELPELAPWVVFMTGGAFTERARSFLANAGRPCVDKPFVVREFRDLVRSTLRKRYPGEPNVPP